MAPHDRRGRLTLAPLSSAAWTAAGLIPPATLRAVEALALIVGADGQPDASLVRLRSTGVLAAYCDGSTRALPQAKARAALAALEDDHDATHP